MTLIDVNRSLETEDLCRELLKRLRWPFGVRCLRCKSHAVFELATQKKFECSECHYQFSITTQTIFHDTHLPLETWFLAVLLLLEARKRMSAKQVQRTLRVSYKTAWYLCHRIRRAIARADRPMLHRTVQMQDTYVRGKTRGKRRPATLGDDEIRISIHPLGGGVLWFRAEDVQSGRLAKYIRENISADVEVIVGDGGGAYPHGVADRKHERVNDRDEYVRLPSDSHQRNTAEGAVSPLKLDSVGNSHKRIRAKHVPAYLAQTIFGFNRRNLQTRFLDTLRHMVTADPLTFKELTQRSFPGRSATTQRV